MSRCQAHAEQLTGEEDHCLHDKDDGGLVCCWCGDCFVSGMDHHGEYEPAHSLRAQVADLKARLKAVRRPDSAYGPGGKWARITDLRVRNWREP